MKELYQAFEAESQKPGKAFDELVRRRREACLSVAPEERVLPFRCLPSASLPAIDLAIDHDGDELDESPKLRALALLRTERRLEELDVSLDEAHWRGAPARTLRALDEAYGHELQQYLYAEEMLSTRDTVSD
jgi:hypothetical protein